MKYFRQAIAANDRDQWMYRFMAYTFRDWNQLDSAKVYAQKSLSVGKPSPNGMESATLLYELYKDENPVKALEYHVIAAEYKDSLFNQEKAREIDKLDFEQREREAETQRKVKAAQIASQNRLRMNTILGITFTLFVIAIFLFTSYKRKQKAKQKIELAYNQLKTTQSQLIQAEKMASLGELTAGIAHEIQNPLNFVNNFADVSKEMVDEMHEELAKGNLKEVKAISSDIKQNLEKINHHGKRADSIVKGMLLHSRSDSGEREETDINVLVDEYLRLAYHGLRAKDNSFNAEMITEFDPNLPEIKIVPQDIGRVLLNVINNAFQAIEERRKKEKTDYNPRVSIETSTIIRNDIRWVQILVKDNGFGIPKALIDKIFQPFFTTKPTGQGTGLGLSLSYDIVKAHDGEITVESKEGEGTEFKIKLLLNTEL
jgi:signal transduction histidine kinase